MMTEEKKAMFLRAMDNAKEPGACLYTHDGKTPLCVAAQYLEERFPGFVAKLPKGAWSKRVDLLLAVGQRPQDSLDCDLRDAREALVSERQEISPEELSLLRSLQAQWDTDAPREYLRGMVQNAFHADGVK